MWFDDQGVRACGAIIAVYSALGAVGCDGGSGDSPVPSAHASAAASATVRQAVSAAAASTPQGGTRADACVVMCEHTRALGCASVAECEQSCAALVALEACSAELRGALSCMLKEPQSHWACNEDGLASIRDGYCDREQARYAECLQRAGM